MVKKEVTMLGLTSFFNDMGSELITPVLPSFILLLGGNAFWVGLVSALREAFPTFVKFLGGILGDKFGRKNTTIFGYFTSAIGKLGLSFSFSLQAVLSFVTLDRFGKGIREPARDAWISQLMNHNKGEGFGIQQALDTLGALIGSVLAAFLLLKELPIRLIILIGGFISFLSLIPVSLVKEVENGVKMNKKVQVPLALLIFSFIAYFSAYGVLIPLVEVGDVLKGTFLFIMFNVVYAFLAYPAGKLADKVGKKIVVGIGILFLSLSALTFSFNAFEIGFLVYGIGFALFKGNLNALIGDIIGGSSKGFGILEGVMGLGVLMGNITLGYLLSIIGLNAFYVPLLTGLIAIGILGWLR